MDRPTRSCVSPARPATPSPTAANGVCSSVRVAIRVDGDYRPVSGDLDGNGADDVIWYGVEALPDVRWQMSHTRGHFTRVSASVSGVYTPAAGDFDGDRRDDVLWFTPTSAVGDTVWWAQAAGATASQALRAT